MKGAFRGAGKAGPRPPFAAAARILVLATLAFLSGCASSSKPPRVGQQAPAARDSAAAVDSSRAEAGVRTDGERPGGAPAAASSRSGKNGKPSAGPAKPEAPDSAARSAAGAGPAAPGAPAAPAPPRTEPLIMENADRMEGFRSRGEYILSGKVRFSHGALRLETERAVWLKDRSLIYAEEGMKISHRGAELTSDRGSYDKNQGRATAEGRVRMRDSSGEVEAFGHNVAYLRYKRLATLTGEPEVRRYYRESADSAVPAGSRGAAGDSGKAGRGKVQDTLVIRGQVLSYNDSAQVATAEGQVRITRRNVDITCKRAEYHAGTDSLYLVGDPLVKVDESQVKGLVMRVGMNGEEIRSLLVKGDAHARTVEPATDTSAARRSDVTGDSLFLAFREKAIDSVEVFRNTRGSYFDEDKPEFVNRMSGEYMVLRFRGKKISSANVVGGAKSTYFHLEKRTFKGKNDAEGDTIDFAFKDGKVEEVMVRGSAKGTYFGEPQTRKPLPGDRSPDPAAPPAADTVPAPPPAPGAAPPAPAGSTGTGTGAPQASQPAEKDGRPARAEGANLPNNPWRKR